MDEDGESYWVFESRDVSDESTISSAVTSNISSHSLRDRPTQSIPSKCLSFASDVILIRFQDVLGRIGV